MEKETENLANTDYLDVKSGDDCIVDCSGHKAGFEWAKENDVDDIDHCEDKSQSFIEGCEAYVEKLDSIWNNSENRMNFQQEIYSYIDIMQPDYDVM